MDLVYQTKLMAKISIIVPVYNTAPYLETCLASLKSQTFSDIEVLLINDGSTDESEKICSTFCKADNRFILFTKSNGGLCSARNFGLERAHGDFIMFVDSDDAVSPLFVEKLYRSVLTSNCDMAFSNYIIWNPLADHMSFQGASQSKEFSRREMISIILSLEKKTGASGGYMWNKIFRSNLKPLLFLNHTEGAEDEEILFQILEGLNTNISFVPDPLYYYRIRKGSLVSRDDFPFYHLETRWKLFLISSFKRETATGFFITLSHCVLKYLTMEQNNEIRLKELKTAFSNLQLTIKNYPIILPRSSSYMIRFLLVNCLCLPNRFFSLYFFFKLNNLLKFIYEKFRTLR